MAGLDAAVSLYALEDLGTMAEILRELMLGRRPELLDDQETRWWPEEAVERSRPPRARPGQPISRRSVNARLRKGEHLELMHQQHGPGP